MPEYNPNQKLNITKIEPIPMNREDKIQIVARAMVENCFYVRYNYLGKQRVVCIHCKKIHSRRKYFNHKPDCPVLVAKDLLTEGKEE